MAMTFKERDIKDRFKEEAERKGALVRKINYENRIGCPDWLVAYRGKLYLVELKKPDGKLRPGQEREIRRYYEQGIQVYVLKTIVHVSIFFSNLNEN